MTRFGRWFAGGLLAVLLLFVIGLMLPKGRDGASRRVAHPGRPVTTEPTPSGLLVPVAGVHAADLTDTFGDPRGVDGARGHGALDIMASRGTPVVASAPGTIEKLFDSELGGHTIYVRSRDRRFIYYYAHLDGYAAAVHEGMAVAAGDRIGTVGATGDADPAAPHLHFEIKRMRPGEAWHEGAAINPYPLLAGKAAAG